MLLPNLPLSIDLQVSDLVVTSGLGGRFPRGIPVGTVVDVERPPGEALARARLLPAAALDRSREVLLMNRAEQSEELGVAPVSPDEASVADPVAAEDTGG